MPGNECQGIEEESDAIPKERSPTRPAFPAKRKEEPIRTEVIYYVAASLDGFIATPDGGVQWLSPFEGTGEDYGYAAFYASVDALLTGSRTCEQALGFGEWLYAGKPCRVFSRRQIEAVRPEVTVAVADPQDVLRELEACDLRRAWLVGGEALAASFYVSERRGGVMKRRMDDLRATSVQRLGRPEQLL